MKHLWIFVAFGLMATGCYSPKTISDPNKSDQRTAAVSARTAIFLSDLQQEKDQARAKHLSFVPSASLIEEYQIFQRSGHYYIRGFIEASSSLDEAKLRNAGISIETKAGNLRTVIADLDAIEQLLHWPNIKSFSIATPLSPLK